MSDGRHYKTKIAFEIVSAKPEAWHAACVILSVSCSRFIRLLARSRHIYNIEMDLYVLYI